MHYAEMNLKKWGFYITVETYEQHISQRNVEENIENDNTDFFTIENQILIILFVVRKTIILFLISLVHGFLNI